MNKLLRNILAFTVVIILLLSLSCQSGKESSKTKLKVFYAASFSPVFNALRKNAEKELGIELVTEASGSQVAARKVAELGRECDLLVLADNMLFKQIASEKFNWRIDFCTDEVVLGVGIRAKRTDEAERDWVRVLLDEDVVLGRVNENLAPIGYRTLLVWKLKELAGFEGLSDALKKKSAKVVDDVSSLAALLSSGDIEYGFLYKSTCTAYDIRYIPLEKSINLGLPDIDYSKAEVSFSETSSHEAKIITVKGGMAMNSLSIPINAVNREKAVAFIRYILVEKSAILESDGFIVFKSRFYGSKEHYEPFKDFAEYSGDF